MKLLVGLCLAAFASAAPVVAQPVPETGAATGIAALLGRPSPAQITNGIAPVAPANTWRSPDGAAISVELAPEASRKALPVVDPSRQDPAAQHLRHLYAQGRAAGLWNVIYDNRDRGHSSLPWDSFPQLSRTDYAPAYVGAGLDYGLAGQERFSLPVIGNSSTAVTRGPLSRSQGRAALSSQAEAMRSYLGYAGNQLYVYPEHRDHDTGTGDRLFANTPFFLLSQGSSGSDQPFIAALATIVASYTPETRQRLEDLSLLAPTTQMIFRRARAGIETENDYLSAAAHPSAFDAATLRPDRMVDLANALSPDAIPPMVRLSVLEDLKAIPGRDYLARNLSEEVFTTPTAIARVWRSFAYSREMMISADSTRDPDGRALIFHWVVLRGDPARIAIAPQNAAGRIARIRINWQDATVADAVTGLSSTRIDIGVFADNGVSLSAPAMLSIDFPAYQNRKYVLENNGIMALSEMNYVQDPQDPYADPLLWPTAPWHDEFLRDVTGAVSLRRTFRNGKVQIVRFGEDVSPSVTTPDGVAALRHTAVSGPKGNLVLKIDPPGTATGP